MFGDRDNRNVKGGNEIVQEQHYYPFGMTFGGNVWMNESTDIDYHYQYNGKELNNDHGLGSYNYGARFYDADYFAHDLIKLKMATIGNNPRKRRGKS